MLSKYIKTLLELHNRVIVPDLGAFMLKPDSQDIYFNEFLRFNDGLLVDYVAETEKIEKLEAIKKVKVYVDNINKQLSVSKIVEVEGLGTLTVDANEKIQLKSAGQAQTASTSQPETKPEVKPTPSPEIQPQAQPQPAPVNPVPPVQKEQIMSTPQESPKPIQPKQSIKPQQEKNMKKPTPKLEKKDEFDVVPTNTRNLLIFGVLGLLVVSAIIYFLFFRSPENNSLKQNPFGNADSSVVEKDSTNKEPVVKPAVKKPTYVAPTKTVSSRKYHLISGAFTYESNADRRVKQMLGEGYQVEKLTDTNNNMFYVSIASFDSKTSAFQEMKRLKEANTITWLYTR